MRRLRAAMKERVAEMRAESEQGTKNADDLSKRRQHREDGAAGSCAP